MATSPFGIWLKTYCCRERCQAFFTKFREAQFFFLDNYSKCAKIGISSSSLFRTHRRKKCSTYTNSWEMRHKSCKLYTRGNLVFRNLAYNLTSIICPTLFMHCTNPFKYFIGMINQLFAISAVYWRVIGPCEFSHVSISGHTYFHSGLCSQQLVSSVMSYISYKIH